MCASLFLYNGYFIYRAIPGHVSHLSYVFIPLYCHFLINSFAADIIKNCEIDRKPRGKERPSDHTPIICEF